MANTRISQDAFAKEFGVARVTIQRAQYGTTWAHVT